MYSYNEKIDILLIFGECKRNAREAAILYATRYSKRHHPCATMFYNIEKNLRNYGEFEKKKRNKPAHLIQVIHEPKITDHTWLKVELNSSGDVDKKIIYVIEDKATIDNFEILSLEQLEKIVMGLPNKKGTDEGISSNGFGTMVSRFNILRSPLRYDPDDARWIVLAICCLHNMLRSHNVDRMMYTPPGYVDMEDERTGQLQHGEWRNGQRQSLLNLQHQGGNRHASTAIAMRETLCEYFNTVGRVPWQDEAIR
ncbi:hypothetical protein ALC57_05855 [Trachymyrmex cornetzi]|uniref:DUF4817 domain-containing protein n=1 Tax=Trachymyrmex cornetzi TaxID=471704 RepID=A0A151J9P3_9HYME|nr:hypothetical protein ALC57_05855 [Trachymyrmex cornetzi]